jgi:hypothetical protein
MSDTPLKHYRLAVEVQHASGKEIYEISATSPEDARRLFDEGEGELIDEDYDEFSKSFGEITVEEIDDPVRRRRMAVVQKARVMPPLDQ